MKKTTLALAGLLLGSMLATGDERATAVRAPLWIDADVKPIPEPPERDVSEAYDVLRNTWLRHIDFGYLGVTHAHRPALNVNAWDEVPDSSWFTNRIGRRDVGIEELLEGPPGLAPVEGSWQILQLKTEGYTPGFQFRDSAEQRFVLKFDLADAPERNSAADRIGSLLVHAAGYYAPKNTIVYFRPDDLELDEDAVFEDLLGRKRPMTQDDLDAAIATLGRRSDGTYRGLASHFVPGSPKGNFPYSGMRKDDPNDIIPHELRRELRGFRVIASWFNHVDVKEVNNLDVYMKTVDGGYLRHYLIDFGSTMGSGNFMNGPRRVGHEYIFDGSAMFKSLATLGGWERPWEAQCEVVYPEVGHFEADLFDAAAWKPNYPNLAFIEMSASDAYWGAKIVTAFNRHHIRVLAAAGDYSRAEVAAYVERTFLARRDKIGLHWFDLVSPLEAFALELGRDVWTLRFDDLGVGRGYADEGARIYRFEVRSASDGRILASGEADSVGMVRFEPPVDIAWTPTDRFGRRSMVVVSMRTRRRDGSEALPVEVVLGREDSRSETRVLGWTHAPK